MGSAVASSAAAASLASALTLTSALATALTLALASALAPASTLALTLTLASAGSGVGIPAILSVCCLFLDHGFLPILLVVCAPSSAASSLHFVASAGDPEALAGHQGFGKVVPGLL